MNLNAKRTLRAVLATLAVSTASAQEPAKPRLQILVIGGEGSINNVKQRTAREPVVEVQDENNRPVAGAIVIFKVPNYGASGTFSNGSKMITVTTDQLGRAKASFTPDQVAGDLQMEVTASSAGRTASTVIHMQNVKAAAAITGKAVAIIAAVAGAAAVGVVAATRGGGSTPAPVTPVPTSPTTITAGTGTVGPRP